MKALLSTAPGGPETLELADISAPEPGEGQIRVAVEACGINFPDVLIIQDLYQFKPARPFAPGAEFAGTVDLVGPGVTGLAPGDRVMGSMVYGALAEQVCIDASRCFRIPDDMPMTEGAALLLTYGTSYYALERRAAIRPGETLLVLGAAGGVGLAAVDLGKAMGARVIGAVSTPEKAAAVKQRGADEVIIYPAGTLDRAAAKAFTDRIRGASGGGVDVIYDAVGGSYAEPALRAINWEGRYLVVGFPAGIPAIPLNLALLKSCQIVGVFWGGWIERALDEYRQDVSEILALYAAGKIRPLVSATYPLSRGGDAIAHLASRSAIGKVVVTMAE